MTNNFSNNLKILRKENKLSQHDLASYLNISSKTISSWEKRRSEPKIDMLLKLCDYFHVTLDGLIKGMEEKRNDKR